MSNCQELEWHWKAPKFSAKKNDEREREKKTTRIYVWAQYYENLIKMTRKKPKNYFLWNEKKLLRQAGWNSYAPSYIIHVFFC